LLQVLFGTTLSVTSFLKKAMRQVEALVFLEKLLNFMRVRAVIHVHSGAHNAMHENSRHEQAHTGGSE